MPSSTQLSVQSNAGERNWRVIPFPADTPPELAVQLLRDVARTKDARLRAQGNGILLLEVFVTGEEDFRCVETSILQALTDLRLVQAIRQESALEIRRLVNAVIARATGS